VALSIVPLACISPASVHISRISREGFLAFVVVIVYPNENSSFCILLDFALIGKPLPGGQLQYAQFVGIDVVAVAFGETEKKTAKPPAR
jgi:hypothetical protein